MTKGGGLCIGHIAGLKEAIGRDKAGDGRAKVGLTLHHYKWNEGGKLHEAI